MTCIRKGLSNLALNRPRPSITGGEINFIGTAFKAIFWFLIFTCFELFLLYFVVTFGQNYLWTLC